MCSISEKMSLCLIMPETQKDLQNVSFAAKKRVFKSAFYKM